MLRGDFRHLHQFGKYYTACVTRVISAWQLQIFNRKAVLQTRGVAFESHGHLTVRECLRKDAIELHYGKCRLQSFGSWPILGTESLDISASAAFILTI